MATAQVIESPETRLRYRIDRLIGAGGFGQAYLARRLGSSSQVPAVVCIKASRSIDGWLREAYFGQVLEGHPRAIRVFDVFPLLLPDTGVLYCLALEYASQGDLRAFLHRTGTGWPETTARREIAGLLLWSAAPRRCWHLAAAAVQALFAATNLAHWQTFVSADILAAGYGTTSMHLLFVVLQGLAARAATGSGSLTAAKAT